LTSFDRETLEVCERAVRDYRINIEEDGDDQLDIMSYLMDDLLKIHKRKADETSTEI